MWHKGILLDIWVEENALVRICRGDIFPSREKAEEQWKEIKKKEIMMYLEGIYDKFGIRYFKRDKAERIINKYMEKFSLAQILSIIQHVTAKSAQRILLANDKEQVRREEGYNILEHLGKYYSWSQKDENKDKIRQVDLDKFNISWEVKYFYYNVLNWEETIHT